MGAEGRREYRYKGGLGRGMSGAVEVEVGVRAGVSNGVEVEVAGVELNWTGM